MKSIDIVFVVLTYINCDDLINFFDSLSNIQSSYEVIVVDAFYSEESSECIKKIALDNNAVYKRIKNKGYSYGNNKGIEIAKSLYDYKYIIISNPDILVQKLDLDELDKYEFDIMGPYIVNKKNQKQNPMYYKDNYLIRRMIYSGMKKNRKLEFLIAVGIAKINRAFWDFVYYYKKMQPVFQIHGCFIIFSKQFLESSPNVFDENMFLFAEESYLSWKIKERGGTILYNKNISVVHKEDGSMSLVDGLNKKSTDSNIYVFEKYYKMKK